MRSLTRFQMLMAGLVLGVIVAGGAAWAVTTVAPTPSDRFYACVSPQGQVRASAIKLNVAPTKCPSANDAVRSWSAGQIDATAQQCGAFPHPGVSWYVPGSAPKQGCNMAGANLTGANFHQADLRNAVLAGATLNGANLSDADLRGVDLTNATLSAANLHGANLTGVDLSTADLNVVSSGGIVGTPVLPAGWINSGGVLVGPGADLRGVDLSNVDLGTLDLSTARLEGVKSGYTTGTPKLAQDWSLTRGYLIGPGADLSGRDMTGIDLTGRWLSDSNFAGANLTGANLQSSSLAGADLTGSNLTNANLAGANLQSSVLTGANVTGITISGGSQPTNLHGVVTGGLVPSSAQLPWAYAIRQGYLIGPYVSLAGASLAGTDLRDVNVSHVDATGADLSYSVASNETMGSGYSGGYGSDFSYGTFRNANMSSMNLRRVNFVGADLTGANMVGADVAGAMWGSTICPDGYRTDPAFGTCAGHLTP